MILYQGVKWLLISQVDEGDYTYQGRLRQCNYSVKIVVDGELCEFDTLIEAISFSVTNTSMMTILDGKIKVLLPRTVISQLIKEAQRFIIMGRVWKVIGVDRTKIGLIELHADKEPLNPNTDDVENEIANKNEIAVWDIVIEDFRPQILKGETHTYIAKILKDGTAVTNRNVLWQTDDESIVSIQDGIAVAHQFGKVNLVLTIEGSNSVRKVFEVEVVEHLDPVVTYKMWCMYVGEGIKYYDFFDVLENETAQYSVEKYVDGVLATMNDTYTFALEQGDIPADRYTFRVVSNAVCEITCHMRYSSSKMKLKATSNQTGKSIEVFIELMGF